MSILKIGIITDIHNNVVALQSVLKLFEDKQCNYIICCGDIIGIGAYPEETVAAVMGIPNLLSCVRGNHERYLIEGTKTTKMSLDEMQYHQWEHERLSDKSKKFIEDLPYKDFIRVGGVSIYVAHYSMNEDNRYINYTPNPTLNDLKTMFPIEQADIVLYGHNHKPSVLHNTTWYINCGSLGCPAQEKNIARAGILSIENGIFFEPIQTQYDVTKTICDIDTFNFPAKEEIKKFFYGI